MARKYQADQKQSRRKIDPEKRKKFDEIDRQLKEEVRNHPDELGTLADISTVGGGGETLGENIQSVPSERARSHDSDDGAKDEGSDAA